MGGFVQSIKNNKKLDLGAFSVTLTWIKWKIYFCQYWEWCFRVGLPCYTWHL